MVFSLDQMIEEYWKFAETAFDTLPSEAISGLKDEADELKEELLKHESGNGKYSAEIIEMADVFFYTIYILKRRGYDVDDLIRGMSAKLEVLKKRKWNKQESGCYRHTPDSE